MIISDSETKSLSPFSGLAKPRTCHWDEQIWLGLERDNGTWSWTDGTSMDFTKWKVNEPNNNKGKENCGHMWVTPRCNVTRAQVGEWNDNECHHAMTVICKKSKDSGIKLLKVSESRKFLILAPVTVIPTTPVPDKRCAQGYSFFNGNCYKWSSARKTWTEAEATCHSEGGHLASVHSEDENKFVTGKHSSESINILNKSLFSFGYQIRESY